MGKYFKRNNKSALRKCFEDVVWDLNNIILILAF